MNPINRLHRLFLSGRDFEAFSDGRENQSSPNSSIVGELSPNVSGSFNFAISSCRFLVASSLGMYRRNFSRTSNAPLPSACFSILETFFLAIFSACLLFEVSVLMRNSRPSIQVRRYHEPFFSADRIPFQLPHYTLIVHD